MGYEMIKKMGSRKKKNIFLFRLSANVFFTELLNIIRYIDTMYHNMANVSTISYKIVKLLFSMMNLVAMHCVRQNSSDKNLDK